MPNSIKAAKEILKAAAAEAALSEEKSVKWDLGKRWDCMQSIEKQQQKLSKMGVHSILIMVAENPRKEPTRKISTTGGFADLIHNGQVGKAFALECLKFTPKWSNDVNYKEKRKRTHSQTTLEKSDVPVEENNMPVEESCANIETREIVPAANLQLQMESNTVGLMSNLQAQISSKPVAGPSKNGDSHIFTNYENSRVDSRMPQIGPSSRKGPTASSNTLMSNFQARVCV